MDGVADTEEKRDRYIRTIYNKVNDMNSLIEGIVPLCQTGQQFRYLFLCKGECGMLIFRIVWRKSASIWSPRVLILANFNYADRDTVIIADPEQLKRVVEQHYRQFREVCIAGS